MDGQGDTSQEGTAPRGNGDGLPLVVDSGEGTTLQYGQSNIMVITHLPENTEALEWSDMIVHSRISSWKFWNGRSFQSWNGASDIPQVIFPEVASDSPGQLTSQDERPTPKVILTGKNTNAQVGKVNRAVITRVPDQVVEESPSPVLSMQPTTEAVQVSSALFSSDLGLADDGSRSLTLQRDALVTPSGQSTGNKQTFPRNVEHSDETQISPTTPLDLNIPLEEEHHMQGPMQRSINLNQPQTDMPPPENSSDNQGNTTRSVASNKDKVEVCDKKTQTYLDADESDDDEDDNVGGVCFQQVRGDYVTQFGQNNTVVDIQIDQGFLEEAKRGGEVTVTPNGGPIITLTWKGVVETVESVKSSWTLTFSELMENMQSEFLEVISHDIFSPLRKKVTYFFQKYDARLLEIRNGSLVFVFWHLNEESAQRMFGDKEEVKRVFHRLMLSIGKGDADFSLEVSISKADSSVEEPRQIQHGFEEERPLESPSESDPLASIPLDLNYLAQVVHSRIQQSNRGDTTKHTVDVEDRLKSMESGFQQLQREMGEQATASRTELQRNMKEMREVKDLMISLMMQGQTKPDVDPVAAKLENTLSALSALGKQVSGKHPSQTSIPGQKFIHEAVTAYIEAIKTDPGISSKLNDEQISERNENQRDAGKDILDELSPPCGEEDKLNSDRLREAEKDFPMSEESIPTRPQGSTGRDGSDQRQDKRTKESFESSSKVFSRKPRSQKVFDEAERLLSNLNVASVGRSTTNKEVKRLANAVAEALVDDDPPPPRAKTMDTLLCLDVSESIGAAGLDDVKRIAINFVDGIQDIAEQHGLEENLGVIAMGGGARIVQQLTNDYGCVRDAIEALGCGGRSPIFETLTVCVAAIKGRGGVLSVGGAHNIRPRIIFITDGHATNDAYETGPDVPSTDHNTKIQLIRLVSEFSPKEHSSTPNPIIWVSVGNADRSFLASLAKLGGGMLVEGKDVTTLCSYYRIQESVGKIYICVKNNKSDWENLPGAIEAVADALAADLQPEEKREVIQAVQHKLENKEVKNPDSDPNDYEYIHEVKDLPPIGTRVIRGPDWKYGDQDTGGPGTVINHAKDENLLWALWDLNDTVCRYRFGLGGKYDVFQVDDQPRILMQDELIEIGVKVKRGPDWSHSDTDGGPGTMGVVIRKRRDGKVKVRWPNGTVKSCRYGYDGKFDLEICSLDELMEGTREQAAAQTTPALPQQDIEKGGYEKPTIEKPHALWQWQDDIGQWRLYDREHIDKLNKEFNRRPGGSCVLQKDGRDHRVMFREMLEKCLKDGTRRDVQRLVVTDEDRDQLICVEISLNEGSSWAR